MKSPITVWIDAEVLEKIKDMVFWNPEYTLTSFVNLTLKEASDKFTEVKPRPKKYLRTGRRV